uniref:BZIP domain-containing protein n=1 Tax=Auxenochlorella protothecoides TaxID=3075 RepID=A0A1D2A3G7_AUXPR
MTAHCAIDAFPPNFVLVPSSNRVCESQIRHMDVNTGRHVGAAAHESCEDHSADSTCRKSQHDRERSRRNQAMYRARKREEWGALENDFAETKGALASARAEHAQLTKSAVLLEASVDLRSTLLEMLQAAQQSGAGWERPHAAPFEEPGLSFGQMVCLEAACQVARQQDSPTLSQGDMEVFRRRPMLEVGREFRANVESMVEILAKHGAGVRLPHAAEEAVEGILGRQRRLLWQIATYRRGQVHSIMESAAAESKPIDRDADAVWQDIARQVRLSPAQRVELDKYRDALRSTIHSAQAERAHVLKCMEEMGCGTPGASCLANRQMLAWRATTQDLSASLSAERNAYVEHCPAMFGRIMDTRQRAIVIIASHPLLPDLPLLMDHLLGMEELS